MTTVTWCADIHLDHADVPAQERFLAQVAAAPGDVIVICGDISTSRQLESDLERIAEAAGRPVVFTLGNHDHYGGSVAGVRDLVIALAERRDDIQWLPPTDPLRIDANTVLVGVDGWADGRHGNALTTPLRLNDDRFIAEFAEQPDRSHRLAVRRALADADAARLTTLLDRAAEDARHLVIATHVPPFVEVLPTRGHLATPDWWPLLICGATGTAITDAAERHPDHRFTVIAGHTHVAADVMIGERARVITGAARYGDPKLQSLELP